MPRPALLLIALVAALLPFPLVAQSIRDTLPDSAPPERAGVLSDSLIRAGRYVRGRLDDGARVWGVVREVRGDTLVLRERYSSGPERLVPASSLRQLEVRRNPNAKSASVQAGMLLGMLAGGVGYLEWCNKNKAACARDAQGDPNRPVYCDQQDDRFAIGSLFITAGTLLGGAVGYILTPPTWRRAGIAIGAAVTPAPDGSTSASMGARVPFAALAGRR